MQTPTLDTTQIRELINNLGIKIQYETGHELVGLCPFHDNTDSPALNINKQSGLWKCWSGNCGATGNLLTMLTRMGYSGSEARKRLLHGSLERSDFEGYIYSLLHSKDPQKESEWDWTDIASFREQDADQDFPAREYLLNRGVTQEAYDFFVMGYSGKRRMITIPVISESDEVLGIIGRSIDHKQYMYSTGLDRSRTIWNINNTKMFGSIILTEGALDSVAIWQAGFKNVGAVFGSSISENQWRLIYKYFDTVYCFFDNDKAGQGLTDSIVHGNKYLNIQVVQYPDRLVGSGDTERPVKDPGELTPDEISEAIENSRSSIQYLV